MNEEEVNKVIADYMGVDLNKDIRPDSGWNDFVKSGEGLIHYKRLRYTRSMEECISVIEKIGDKSRFVIFYDSTEKIWICAMDVTEQRHWCAATAVANTLATKIKEGLDWKMPLLKKR